MSAEMLRQPSITARRLREGGEFVRFLGRRGRAAAVTDHSRPAAEVPID
jgi:hypothetical protein